MSQPATVDRAEQGELTIEVKKPGRILIRIPYSPWLGLVDAIFLAVPFGNARSRRKA